MNTDDLINNGNRCVIPWIHTEINLQTNNVKPCCKYEKELGTADNFVKIWSSAEYQQLRSDIVNDRIHQSCSACAVPANAFSYKNFKNSHYLHRYNKPVNDNPPLPDVFHFSLKNTCNLACRMCRPESSSKLLEVSNKNQFLKNFYNYIPVDNNYDLNKLQGSFVNAKHITISGGEPLIDSDCQALIEMIASESTTLRSISFSSNMTRYNKNLLEALRKLNVRVEINISIDGPQHIHEYIRWGCDWQDIIDNIIELKDFIHFKNINSTVSVLNVGYLPELITAIRDIERQTDVKFSHIMASPVLESHLHCGNLPNDIKLDYIERLKSFDKTLSGSTTLIQTGLDLLYESKNNWDLTKKFLVEFDNTTRTNFRSVYPEFSNI